MLIEATLLEGESAHPAPQGDNWIVRLSELYGVGRKVVQLAHDQADDVYCGSL